MDLSKLVTELPGGPIPKSNEAPVQPGVNFKQQFDKEMFAETFRIGADLEKFIAKLQNSRVYDPEWIKEAKRQFQLGMMSVRRAVMNDDRF